ncbi:MAG: hypothetical protein GX800_05125 [Clostridiaceae bacterium]|jgi:hypothetical protein|nr:hypothetical protein [Clostridiaceae bacterium]
MVVAVTSVLGAVAQQLRALGYNVVEYGKYNYPIDALVYLGEGLLSSRMLGCADSSGQGVLMVNAQNKTIAQIDYALKNRVYTPLF